LESFSSEGLSKSRKSSGFSETHSGGGSGGGSSSGSGGGSGSGGQDKSRQCSSFTTGVGGSNMEPSAVNGPKSRNCSGGSSISAGLVSSGILPPAASPPASASSNGVISGSPPTDGSSPPRTSHLNGHDNVSCTWINKNINNISS